MTATLTADQQTEVTFISGITASGTAAAHSGQTWNGDDPATYNTMSTVTKWGSSTPGTTGGTVIVGFDSASNWTPAEQTVFKSYFDLWSAESNIKFTLTSDPTTAQITVTRNNSGAAFADVQRDMGDDNSGGSVAVGSATINTAHHAILSVDTDPVTGFGPVNGSFNSAAGLVNGLLHEIGHTLGLGHAGPYNGAVDVATQQLTALDNHAFSIMSYIATNDPASPFAATTQVDWGTVTENGDTEARLPSTPMIGDILAIQRLYGAPVDTPLSGGQVFGFNTNITGDIQPFFDFTQNTTPVLTLFDTGTGNTFDVSGFTQGSTLNLNEGQYSSVDGLTNNIGIDFNTRIDTAITGSGNDTITANLDGDSISTGAGNDTVILHAEGGTNTVDGGAGNDVLDLTANSATQAQTLTNDVNFETLDVQTGVWTLAGSQSFSAGVTIEAGASLQIGQGATAAVLTGDISFATTVGLKTLSIAASSLTAGNFSNVIKGFGGSDTIDVGGLGAHAHATLGAGNVLTIVGDGGTATLHLDANQSFSGEVFTATSDSQGGDVITISAAPPSGPINGPTGVQQGSDGNDTLTAGSGPSTVNGGGGDDHLNGGTGPAVLYGNAGNDTITLFSYTGGSTVFGGMGDDYVDASHSTQANFISGDLGNDTISLGSGADTAYSGGGDDTIIAGSGHDQLYGNAGNDQITIGAANAGSTVFGGQGDDHIDASGSTHANFISADAGNDYVTLGAGADTAYGGDGADTLVGGSGHDQLYGNAGSDYIFLGSNNLGSTVYGGQGGDVIDASRTTQANYISGDAGTDIILGGTGSDTIHGGEGSDTIEAASGSTEHIHVGLADSSALAGAGVTELDHITGFGSGDVLVFDGDPAGTSANTLSHGGDASIANFAAAYAYAYGDGTHAGAISGVIEYAVVSDASGHVYVFAADHAAVELDGLANGVNGVTSGQLLAA